MSSKVNAWGQGTSGEGLSEDQIDDRIEQYGILNPQQRCRVVADGSLNTINPGIIVGVADLTYVVFDALDFEANVSEYSLTATRDGLNLLQGDVLIWVGFSVDSGQTIPDLQVRFRLHFYNTSDIFVADLTPEEGLLLSVIDPSLNGGVLASNFDKANALSLNQPGILKLYCQDVTTGNPQFLNIQCVIQKQGGVIQTNNIQTVNTSINDRLISNPGPDKVVLYQDRLDMELKKVQNLGAPTVANDAARKTDVDTVQSNLDAKTYSQLVSGDTTTEVNCENGNRINFKTNNIERFATSDVNTTFSQEVYMDYPQSTTNSALVRKDYMDQSIASAIAGFSTNQISDTNTAVTCAPTQVDIKVDNVNTQALTKNFTQFNKPAKYANAETFTADRDIVDKKYVDDGDNNVSRISTYIRQCTTDEITIGTLYTFDVLKQDDQVNPEITIDGANQVLSLSGGKWNIDFDVQELKSTSNKYFRQITAQISTDGINWMDQLPHISLLASENNDYLGNHFLSGGHWSEVCIVPAGQTYYLRAQMTDKEDASAIAESLNFQVTVTKLAGIRLEEISVTQAPADRIQYTPNPNTECRMSINGIEILDSSQEKYAFETNNCRMRTNDLSIQDNNSSEVLTYNTAQDEWRFKKGILVETGNVTFNNDLSVLGSFTIPTMIFAANPAGNQSLVNLDVKGYMFNKDASNNTCNVLYDYNNAGSMLTNQLSSYIRGKLSIGQSVDNTTHQNIADPNLLTTLYIQPVYDAFNNAVLSSPACVSWGFAMPQNDSITNKYDISNKAWQIDVTDDEARLQGKRMTFGWYVKNDYTNANVANSHDSVNNRYCGVYYSPAEPGSGNAEANSGGFHINGSLRLTNAGRSLDGTSGSLFYVQLTQESDQNFKTELPFSEDVYEKALEIPLRKYLWKDRAGEDNAPRTKGVPTYGYFAQDWLKIKDSDVVTETDGRYNMDYVQAHCLKIASLEKQNEEKDDQLRELYHASDELEQRLEEQDEKIEKMQEIIDKLMTDIAQLKEPKTRKRRGDKLE